MYERIINTYLIVQINWKIAEQDNVEPVKDVPIAKRGRKAKVVVDSESTQSQVKPSTSGLLRSSKPVAQTFSVASSGSRIIISRSKKL